MRVRGRGLEVGVRGGAGAGEGEGLPAGAGRGGGGVRGWGRGGEGVGRGRGGPLWGRARCIGTRALGHSNSPQVPSLALRRSLPEPSHSVQSEGTFAAAASPGSPWPRFPGPLGQRRPLSARGPAVAAARTRRPLRPALGPPAAPTLLARRPREPGARLGPHRTARQGARPR